MKSEQAFIGGHTVTNNLWALLAFVTDVCGLPAPVFDAQESDGAAWGGPCRATVRVGVQVAAPAQLQCDVSYHRCYCVAAASCCCTHRCTVACAVGRRCCRPRDIERKHADGTLNVGVPTRGRCCINRTRIHVRRCQYG